MAKPKAGDKRVKKKFLLLPRKFNNEWRWFSTQEILQLFTDSGTKTFYDYTSAGWVSIGWNDQIKDVEFSEMKLNMFTCCLYKNLTIHYKNS